MRPSGSGATSGRDNRSSAATQLDHRDAFAELADRVARKRHVVSSSRPASRPCACSATRNSRGSGTCFPHLRQKRRAVACRIGGSRHRSRAEARQRRHPRSRRATGSLGPSSDTSIGISANSCAPSGGNRGSRNAAATALARTSSAQRASRFDAADATAQHARHGAASQTSPLVSRAMRDGSPRLSPSAELARDRLRGRWRAATSPRSVSAIATVHESKRAHSRRRARRSPAVSPELRRSSNAGSSRAPLRTAAAR